MTEPSQSEVLDMASRRSLHVFAERAAYLLVKDYIHAPYLDIISAALEKVVLGETKRLVVSVPPRHLKTILGVAMSAFYLGLHPERPRQNCT